MYSFLSPIMSDKSVSGHNHHHGHHSIHTHNERSPTHHECHLRPRSMLETSSNSKHSLNVLPLLRRSVDVTVGPSLASSPGPTRASPLFRRCQSEADDVQPSRTKKNTFMKMSRLQFKSFIDLKSEFDSAAFMFLCMCVFARHW